MKGESNCGEGARGTVGTARGRGKVRSVRLAAGLPPIGHFSVTKPTKQVKPSKETKDELTPGQEAGRPRRCPLSRSATLHSRLE